MVIQLPMFVHAMLSIMMFSYKKPNNLISVLPLHDLAYSAEHLPGIWHDRDIMPAPPFLSQLQWNSKNAYFFIYR